MRKYLKQKTATRTNSARERPSDGYNANSLARVRLAICGVANITPHEALVASCWVDSPREINFRRSMMADVKKNVLSIFEKLRNMEGLLSPSALAEILNLKTDTLQKRRSRKVRPWWITLSANRVAYDPAEVADWLQSLSTAPADEWNESSTRFDTTSGPIRVLRGDE